MYRILLDFAESFVLSGSLKFDEYNKKFSVPFLNYKPIKL